MLHLITKTILGLASLAAGVYGFYVMGQADQILEKLPLLFGTLIFVSTAMTFLGINLIAEPGLQEKFQTKLSEVK
ncbi:MAG: hypothetical protein WAW11_02755 [Patescibacteria group bacterium]